MVDTDSDIVRERAYLIWETEGRPEGRDLEHWLRAERELASLPLATNGKKKRAAAAAVKTRSTTSRPRTRKAKS